VAEGGEIVPADEALRRRMHGRSVEQFADAPGEAAFQGEVGAPADDAIAIVPPDG
jgi:hypothetical protein